MIVQCAGCQQYYDDEFRLTLCPHPTFAANTLDGENNHVHHPESYLSAEPPAPVKPYRWTSDAASKAGRTGGRAARRPRGMGKRRKVKDGQE